MQDTDSFDKVFTARQSAPSGASRASDSREDFSPDTVADSHWPDSVADAPRVEEGNAKAGESRFASPPGRPQLREVPIESAAFGKSRPMQIRPLDKSVFTTHGTNGFWKPPAPRSKAVVKRGAFRTVMGLAMGLLIVVAAGTAAWRFYPLLAQRIEQRAASRSLDRSIVHAGLERR